MYKHFAVMSSTFNPAIHLFVIEFIVSIYVRASTCAGPLGHPIGLQTSLYVSIRGHQRLTRCTTFSWAKVKHFQNPELLKLKS